MRETHEEIGLSLRPLRLIAEIELHAPHHRSYVLFSFLCEPPMHPDEISARSDALDARWLHLNEAMTMPLAPGVATTLEAISWTRTN
jgi:8-oxo-dGTP pyrophosphatase MutT (NUDIX family)